MAAQLEHRIYHAKESVVFYRTNEEFGGLSNMASGYPLLVNGVRILSSEALYQACRFPHKPEVQMLILGQYSPMTAKMKSKPYRKESRSDWDAVRVRIMKWCLKVKLAQNWDTFGDLLLSTGDLPIVEKSRRDDFWGAKEINSEALCGTNVLGRLLMELRGKLKSSEAESLKTVFPPDLPDFLLVGELIGIIQSDTQTRRPSFRDTPNLNLFAPKALIQTCTDVSELSREEMEKEVEVTNDKDKKPCLSYPKRLIEVDLPIKRISAHARREKSIRHGHISTLHIWWARRPLAACRAVICAALWPDPADELCPQSFRDRAAKIITEFAEKAATQKDLMEHCSEETRSKWMFLSRPENRLDSNNETQLNVLRNALLDFIADFANWDNSTQPDYLEASRALTQAAHEALGGEPGTRPLVVDPFAGGGSIPLEALRIGADAFASDLNPVAVLLNKVVLEYIPKYGARLAEEVYRWGEWVKAEAKRELARFYQKDPDGATPIAYLWARTIISEAPNVNNEPIEIPLLRSMWLSKNRNRFQALRWERDGKGHIKTERISMTYADGQTFQVRRPLLEIFEPRTPSEIEKGTSLGGAATCPVTGYTTSVENVRKQLKQRKGGTADARLICVVTISSDGPGKSYRLPVDLDVQAVRNASLRLEQDEKNHFGSLSLLPNGELNHLRGFFNVVLYGMTKWGDLFAPRQALALTTLIRLVNEVGSRFVKERNNELGAAVQTVLALAVDRVAAQSSSLSWWQPNGEFCVGTFGRQALPMVWDYCEIQPVQGGSGDFEGAIDWIIRVIESESKAHYVTGQAAESSATSHPLPDDAAEAIVTDPPYYSAIPYADLSDFFYSWLARSVRNVHPDLFQFDLSPKDDECVALSHRAAMYRHKDSYWFETMMEKACSQSRRIVKPSGVGIFVFANKETSGWEAMLSALISSGWVVTASWPIDTERGVRMRAQNSAALGSSIHLVCRPRENAYGLLLNDDIGDWRDVLQELPKRIHEWMPRLAQEGVVGADAIFACIGPALEIFSRYSRVEKASGEQVTLREYLEYVWAAVAKEALNRIFEGADATGFEEDARLTAMWLWTLSTAQSKNGQASQEKMGQDEESEEEESDSPTSKKQKVGGFLLEYDAARKIAQGLGVYHEKLDNLVEIKGDTARLLSVAERTRYLFGKDNAESPTAKRKKKEAQMKLGFIEELDRAEAEESWGQKDAPRPGSTILDRVHQAMILFAAGRAEAMRRFLVEEGAGNDARFWRLAQALAALYPPGTDERRWVEGVLARKKGLGF